MLITAWNRADRMDQPMRLGDRVARLIGAAPGRKIILSDTGNFRSDLFIAEGLAGLLRQGHRLRIVAPEEIAVAIDDDTAVLRLTEVDHRTGRRRGHRVDADGHARGGADGRAGGGARHPGRD